MEKFEQEKLQSIFADFTATFNFAVRGIIVPPALPKEEADRIKTDHSQAVTRLGQHFIGVLTNEIVTDLLMDKKSGSASSLTENQKIIFRERFSHWEGWLRYERYGGKSLSIKLIRSEERKPSILFELDEYYRPDMKIYEIWGGLDKEKDRRYAEFSERLHSFYPPSEENEWMILQSNGRDNSYHFHAEKNLDANDLASDRFLLRDFLKACGELFHYAHKRLNRFSVLPKEAERMRRITRACLEGSVLIEEAFQEKGEI